MTIFVATSDASFITSDKYFWLCRLGVDTWTWTYTPTFGILFRNEDDAITFRLKYA